MDPWLAKNDQLPASERAAAAQRKQQRKQQRPADTTHGGGGQKTKVVGPYGPTGAPTSGTVSWTSRLGDTKTFTPSKVAPRHR